MEFIKIVISYTHDEKTMADYKQKIFATYDLLGDEFAAKDDEFSKQMMGHSYGKAIRETSDSKLIGGILDKLLEQKYYIDIHDYLEEIPEELSEKVEKLNSLEGK